MGLDMYAFKTDAAIEEAGFKYPQNTIGIAYWRKHPNLHGWMEALYLQKGGTQIFNCECVRLDAADIDALEKAVHEDALPETTGFFFGESWPEDKADDLIFIQNARKALDEGLNVFYTSWW